MAATPGKDKEKSTPMGMYSQMSGVQTLRKQMKSMGERHRKMMKPNFSQNAAEELKRQASLSAELNRRLRAFDYDQFQTTIEKINEEMQTAAEVSDALRTAGSFDSNPYRDLIRSMSIERAPIDMTPSSEALAAMSKASYSDVDTTSLVDTTRPVVQPRGPEVSEVSDERLISETVDRGLRVKCPECGEEDLPKYMELVPAGEDANTEYKKVCRRCASSDIGYQ